MTADEARAVRHSGCKCVPRKATVDMIEAAQQIDQYLASARWSLMYDAAPACECEAERLLRDLVHALGMTGGMYGPQIDAAWDAARAYLARTQP